MLQGFPGSFIESFVDLFSYRVCGDFGRAVEFGRLAGGGSQGLH